MSICNVIKSCNTLYNRQIAPFKTYIVNNKCKGSIESSIYD